MEERSTAGQGRTVVVGDERANGVGGALGAEERTEAVPYVCPEWGLVRLYVDDEDAGGGLSALFGGRS